MNRPTIITLSSIPSRFNLIKPTLDSLLSQSLKAQEIRLYIPETYRRFPEWDGTLPDVPEGVSIHRCDKDYGPATKVLPAARDLKGQDVDILFCDDDMLYDSDWHSRLKKASIQYPNACIVGMGQSFPDITDEYRPLDQLPRGQRRCKGLNYRLLRILSLFTYKPQRYVDGYIDQIFGFAGVIVRPDWFDDLFYEIPDIMWTVDDPWISGHLARKGIPIWRSTGRDLPPEAEIYGIDALHNLVEDGYNRVNADLHVIEYFREKYDIWKPGGTVLEEHLNHYCPTMREVARRAVKKQNII